MSISYNNSVRSQSFIFLSKSFNLFGSGSSKINQSLMFFILLLQLFDQSGALALALLMLGQVGCDRSVDNPHIHTLWFILRITAVGGRYVSITFQSVLRNILLKTELDWGGVLVKVDLGQGESSRGEVEEDEQQHGGGLVDCGAGAGLAL